MDLILFYIPKNNQVITAKKLIETSDYTWETSFYNCGRFTLTMAADDDIIPLLKEQCLIAPMSPRTNENYMKDVMIVEKAIMDEDDTDGKKITLSGRSADAVLSYRSAVSIEDNGGEIKVDSLDYDNLSPPDIVMSIFNEVFQTYDDSYSQRKIPWISMGSYIEENSQSKISVTYKGENVLDITDTLREKYKFGIRTQLIRRGINAPGSGDPEEMMLNLDLYSGRDYTENSRKVIAASNDDIETTDYSIDKTSEINAVIAIRKEDEDEVPVLVDKGNTGFFRKEAYEDLRTLRIAGVTGYGSISINKITQEFNYYKNLKGELDQIVDKNGTIHTGYEERSKFITDKLSEVTELEIQNNGSVIQSYDTISDEIDSIIEEKRVQALLYATEYLSTVRQQASTNLMPPHEKMSVVETENCRYKCRINYDVGDKIIVRDEFGNYGRVRCTKITQVNDTNGYRCIPTFDEWETIPVILRTKQGGRFMSSDDKQIVVKGGK